MSGGHLAGCSSLTTDGMISKLDELLWDHEEPYLEETAMGKLPESLPRDTQFQGFANLLTDELIKYLTSRSGLTLDEIEQEWRKLIAQRAYDLVKHVIAYVDTKDLDMLEEHECVQRIPDMTELPKEAQ